MPRKIQDRIELDIHRSLIFKYPDFLDSSYRDLWGIEGFVASRHDEIAELHFVLCALLYESHEQGIVRRSLPAYESLRPRAARKARCDVGLGVVDRYYLAGPAPDLDYTAHEPFQPS